LGKFTFFPFSQSEFQADRLLPSCSAALLSQMKGSENEASANAFDAEFETRESLGRNNSSGEEYAVPEEVAMLLAMLGNEHAVGYRTTPAFADCREFSDM
jgi:hypothetical protein